MATKRTSEFLRLAEIPRAGFEMASLMAAAPWMTLSPRGDSHPVIVIPGFLADDDSTRILRAYLDHLGYAENPWGHGRNMGAARMGGYESLVSHVLRVHREADKKVSLIGWSLGGVHSLAVAERAAYAVRQVITLGSPIVQEGPTTSLFAALRTAAAALNGVPINTPSPASLGWRDIFERINPKLPVTSIYSRTDGVVPWQRSHIEPAARRDNIEVHSSHIGLGFNPAVFYAIADRLAQPEDTFEPFHRHGWRALTYPRPDAPKPDRHPTTT